jgi:ABC-type glycerol-3-phosphate transport system permease component
MSKKIKAQKAITNILMFLVYFIIALFCLFPILWMIKLSLTPEADNNIIPRSLTLVNYTNLLTNPVLLRYFWNSCRVAGGAILFAIPISLLGGYTLARFRFRGRNIIGVSLLIFPMLSTTVILIPIISYFNKLHIYNSLTGVVIVWITTTIPTTMWLLRNFIVNTPVAIEEAAQIDGLGPIQTMFRITIPMIWPGIMAVIMTTFVNCWNNYTINYALTLSQRNRVLTQAILAQMGTFVTEWGGVTAMGTLTILPPVLLFLIFRKSFIAGMYGVTLK